MLSEQGVFAEFMKNYYLQIMLVPLQHGTSKTSDSSLCFTTVQLLSDQSPELDYLGMAMERN